MALFKPYKITSNKLADLPVREGQIVITTDTKKLYVDVSATERIEITADTEVDLTNYVTQQVLTAALGEETSEREKQDGLLEDLINTKLDTSSADNRYALKNYPELTGNVEITSNGWAGSRIIGAHPNGDVADYYQYVIGFDALHRPYIAKRENGDNISVIYLDTDKIVFNKPLAFTGPSGAESYNSEASVQTRQNIGAAAINHTHDVATAGAAGFMSAEDKTKLDGLEQVDTSVFVTKEDADADYAAISHTHDDRYYTESEVDSKLSGKANATHTHTVANVTNLQETIDGLEADIAGKANATHTHDDRYFTETEITTKLATKADTGHKHAASDITSGTFALDRIPTITDAKISGMSASKLTGTIPTANLPSYVDDVVEGATTEDFPETGEAGKIYVATSTNKTYRWSGSSYVEISASLALGTTSSTAFRGDYGNTAYQHATAKGAAFGSGLYKITTNAQGHVTAATPVTKSDITALGIPGQDTNTTYTLSSFGITATAAELNKLDGVTTTATELNYVDGVTSNIQTQLNGKAASSHTHSNATTSAAGFLPKLGGGTTNYLRADGTWAKPPDTNTTYTLSSFGITATAAELNKLDGCKATVTELNYVDGVTSNIQTQLNGKAASSHTHSYLPLSGGTLTGRLTTNGKISTPTSGGSWINGKTVTNAAYCVTTQPDSAGNSYYPFFATKSGSGHTVNIGCLGNSWGFYGYYSSRTSNGTDWSFCVNAANGNWSSTGQITASQFNGKLNGNASTATTATQANYWTTARTLTFTGNVTGSVSVRGNANMSCKLTLANDSVTSAKIAANAVTASEIASGAVGLSELSSAVGTVAVQSATPTDSHVKLWIKV